MPPSSAPMLARLEQELPVGPGWRYEPKWDGFRCRATVGHGTVTLLSRNARPLDRYFPEVVEALAGLPETTLDGELLAGPDGRPEFTALLERLHPAASRVERLAARTPAVFAAFDVLAVDGTDVAAEPLRVRRDRLERLLPSTAGALLTPQTEDPDAALPWLDGVDPGIDGVVAKESDGAYEPGRRAWVKVKRTRTVDCVVGGVRFRTDGQVGSLLLGLWAGAELRHVGVVVSMAKRLRQQAGTRVRPLRSPLPGHPWEHGFALEGGALGRLKGTAGRWTPDQRRDWEPVRPECVVEVAYDHLEGARFRHPARFVRWRPDRDGATCSLDQLHRPG